MSAPLSLGYSPCPNDTFIFYALVHGRVPAAPAVQEVLLDIETLNGMAARSELDVVKVSFHALGHLLDDYCLLRSGGALGRGCGPLVVARESLEPGELAGLRVAIPGKRTTAALLLRLFAPGLERTVEMPFHRIMGSVRDGDADAGVIIHESRFTFQRCGLCRVLDLGEWWEQTTGHPIPLGGIAARRRLGAGEIHRLEDGLRRSVEYAHAHPEEVRSYVAGQAQEMDPDVMEAHIELYVNDHTLDYGGDGRAAIEELMTRAEKEGILPAGGPPLFL